MKPSADQDEHDAKEQRRLGTEPCESQHGDRGEIGLAGDAENPGDAIDEKAGAERAEDEIFHARLERGGLPAHVGDEDVEADRDQFQRDEDEEEIDRLAMNMSPAQVKTGRL